MKNKTVFKSKMIKVCDYKKPTFRVHKKLSSRQSGLCIWVAFCEERRLLIFPRQKHCECAVTLCQNMNLFCNKYFQNIVTTNRQIQSQTTGGHVCSHFSILDCTYLREKDLWFKHCGIKGPKSYNCLLCLSSITEMQ
jgi:hypothetical protein